MWKKHIAVSIAVLAILWLWAANGFSDEKLPLEVTTEYLANEADNIVLGRVKSMESEWNEDRNFIWTLVTLSVDKTMKGEIFDGKRIIVKIAGGVVGRMALRTSADVKFDEGETVLLFLRKEIYRQKDVFNVVSLYHGKFTIKEDMVLEKQISVQDYLKEIGEAIK